MEPKRNHGSANEGGDHLRDDRSSSLRSGVGRAHGVHAAVAPSTLECRRSRIRAVRHDGSTQSPRHSDQARLALGRGLSERVSHEFAPAVARPGQRCSVDVPPTSSPKTYAAGPSGPDRRAVLNLDKWSQSRDMRGRRRYANPRSTARTQPARRLLGGCRHDTYERPAISGSTPDRARRRVCA